MDARYVFAVRFRLDPGALGVSVDPAAFETRFYRRADSPGEAGWLFFRDNLWRGAVGDERHLRSLATEALGVPVTDVSFRALEADEEYLDALEDAIRTDLDLFNAESVEEVLSKYFGSAIEVRDDGFV